MEKIIRGGNGRNTGDSKETESTNRQNTCFIKSRENGKAVVAGYGVVFGGEDLYGEYFDENTDFMLSLVPEKPVLFNHGLPVYVKKDNTETSISVKSVLGGVPNASIKNDGIGLFIEAVLEESKEYVKDILDLVEKGIIGWSSGTVPHLSEITGKYIRKWPLIEFSLTHTPAEPRTLGVEHVKSLFESAGIDLPKAFIEAEEAKIDAVQVGDGNKTKGTKKMDEKEIQAKIDAAATKAAEEASIKAIEVFEARQAAKEAKAKEEAELREAIREEEREKLRNDAETWREMKGVFGMPKLTDPKKGDHSGTKAYVHWMRTGDARTAEMKSLEAEDDGKAVTFGDIKALQGQTTTEGAYIVPDDFLGEIITQRNWNSWPRAAGVRTMQTSLDQVNIPTEATQFANFSVTAEEAAYTTNDPAFGQVAITVHKMTKLTKVSEELLADNKANLEGYMATAVGEAWGLTESKFTAIGTGSSQPEGVFVGGDTDALTFDTANNITADEIPELFGKLRSGYRQDSVWLMDPQTEAYLRKIRDANSFAFPYANQPLSTGDVHTNTLLGRPVYTDDNIDTIATAKCTIMVGSPRYYMLVERSGLEMSRNPYLYQANGQVGFFWKVRWGGAVLQELAWVGGAQA